LRELRYEWENNSVVVAKNKEYYMNLDEYQSKDGWYSTNMVRGRSQGGTGINYEKLFKGKKAGDVFYVNFILRYSFDDEPEVVEVLRYQVVAGKTTWFMIYGL
jgi:hypothetical protein